MTEGVLGIIGCPMFADNIVYNLAGDPEDKQIFVLNIPETATFRKKLEDAGIRYEVMSSDVFYYHGLPEGSGYRIVVDMLSLGLHSEPEKLKAQVEERVGSIQRHVDVVGLYYGWCGNYKWDMGEWAQKKGFKPLAVFRDSTGTVCDDCVSVAVDGTKRYLEMQKKFTGMLYVFPAMADNAEEFLLANNDDVVDHLSPDVKEYLGITDSDSYFRWMLSIGNYRNLLRLDTGIGDPAVFDEKIKVLEERTRLPILTAPEGYATKGPTDRIYAECKSLLSGAGRTAVRSRRRTAKSLVHMAVRMDERELGEVFQVPLRARGYIPAGASFTRTTNLSAKWRTERDGRVRIWVSDYLVNAPYDVMHDFAKGIVDYIAGDQPVFGPAYTEFINSDEFVLWSRPIYVRRQRNIAMRENGTYRNLIDSVQRLYEDGLLEDGDIRNTAFSWTVGPNYTRLGYCATFARTVAVSSVLDDLSIPEFVLDYVVFHESMHLRQGYRPFDTNPHDPQFRAWMKRFPRAKEAEAILQRIPLMNPGRTRRIRRG